VRPSGDQELDQGRITLLGDAAHPMSVSGAGGNTAMEDAVCPPIRSRRPAATTRQRSKNIRSCDICAPRGCSSWLAYTGYHASGVNRELRNALREWAGQGGVDMSWLYGQQPELPYIDNVLNAAANPARIVVNNQSSEGVLWRNSTICLKTS
jgi:hypothetical protein